MKLIDRYDTFIFDWDGTLAEIMFVNRINETVNFLWRRRKERSRRAAMRARRREIVKREEREAREAKEYKSFIDFLMLLTMPKLHDGTLETLKLLSKRGKKVALFTNGAYWRVSKEAKHLKVFDYFDYFLSAQTIAEVKPNPLGINMILERLKGKRRRTLYIGDMVDDILTARLAKVDCAAVECGFDRKEALRDERPKYLFKDMRQLYNSLE